MITTPSNKIGIYSYAVFFQKSPVSIFRMSNSLDSVSGPTVFVGPVFSVQIVCRRQK